MIELKRVAIDEIVPYWRNPKDNNEQAIAKVASSIQTFGYQSPILVDRQMVIIAGHTRYKALRKLGVQEVDVIISDIGGKLAKEYRVVDNKTTEYSNWIIENVMAEYAELPTALSKDEFFPMLGVDGATGRDEASSTPTEPQPSQAGSGGRVELEDDDYVELICPNCMNGFEPTWSQAKELLNG